MRHVGQDLRVLERARLALVGVADDVLRESRLLLDQRPLLPGGEPGPAHPANARRLQFGQRPCLPFGPRQAHEFAKCTIARLGSWVRVDLPSRWRRLVEVRYRFGLRDPRLHLIDVHERDWLVVQHPGWGVVAPADTRDFLDLDAIAGQFL